MKRTINNIEVPTRDFVDAVDVKGIYLYRKDGYILSYLRVYSFNLDLLPLEDKRAKTDMQAAGFKEDGKAFVYFTLPREIDLDRYKENLKKRYKRADTIGKRHLIENDMEQCAELTTNGENYEHQHFIRIWKQGSSDRVNAENELKDRINDFKRLYRNVGIKAEILQEQEIVKLCNLFGNSLQASFENVEASTMYTPILQLEE